MRLNLKDVIHVPGASVPFDFSLDLSGEELNGGRPFCEPVAMTGRVRNMAGALVLSADVVTTLSLCCDRCTKPYRAELLVPIETLLATELAEEASEGEIILLEKGELDLGGVATTAVILAMDSKNLCSEDCKGICAVCGADLNEEPCRCTPEVDPRLAALAQLLEEKSE